MIKDEDEMYTSEKLATLLMARDAGESVDENEIRRLRILLKEETAETAAQHAKAGHINEYEWVAGLTKQKPSS